MVAARTPTERSLAALWQSLLRLDAVSVEDDFFDLGGHSLLAVQFVSRVRRDLGKNLSLASLFRYRTIARLAAMLDGNLLRQEAGLVPLAEDEEKPPLFLVHPTGGNVFCYVSLARHLADDYSVFGVQARGLTLDEHPFVSLADMAAHYAALIREFHPRGPYLIGGWSLGGVIAFEVAARLLAMGSAPEQVLLFDSFLPRSGVGNWLSKVPGMGIDDRKLIIPFALEMGLPLFDLGITQDQIAKRKTADTLSAIHEQAIARDFLPDDISIQDLSRFFAVFTTHLRAVSTHKFKPIEVELSVFKASAMSDGQMPRGDQRSMWTKLTTHGLNLYMADGNHMNMLQGANGKSLAELIRKKIPRPALLPTRDSGVD
jgi:thioesterase domain-containing protein/acyl carrier protein